MSVAAHRVVRMKPSAADVPYSLDRDVVTSWEFELAYAGGWAVGFGECGVGRAHDGTQMNKGWG